MSTSIYNQGVLNDSDHIRIVNAIWSYQNRAHPKSLEMNVVESATSGIVLVHDTITDEYTAYWGTFACYSPSASDILSDARHIAQWGNRLPPVMRDACFPFLQDMINEKEVA